MAEQGDAEEERLEALCEPLFGLFVRFQDAFARAAIDKMNITDEDAEKIAGMMEGSGSKIGRAFAYLMRQVVSERLLRSVNHDVVGGWNDPLPLDKGLN